MSAFTGRQHRGAMRAHRKAKRQEAEARNEAWAGLPRAAKLERLHRRPGFSARQRERVMADVTDRIAERAIERRAS